MTLELIGEAFEEFGDISPSAVAAAIAAIEGGVVPNFVDSALDLLGDIVDPFLPGGAGSELRPTAFGGDVSRQNRARAAAGLPLISTGRRRRRKALTDSDMRIIAEISSGVSKKAAELFIAQRVRRG